MGASSGGSAVSAELKSLPLPQLQERLNSSPDGLAQAEVHRRLAQYGYNEIAEKQTNPFLKFLAYFWGPIPWMIEAAVILSALVRHCGSSWSRYRSDAGDRRGLRHSAHPQAGAILPVHSACGRRDLDTGHGARRCSASERAHAARTRSRT